MKAKERRKTRKEGERGIGRKTQGKTGNKRGQQERNETASENQTTRKEAKGGKHRRGRGKDPKEQVKKEDHSLKMDKQESLKKRPNCSGGDCSDIILYESSQTKSNKATSPDFQIFQPSSTIHVHQPNWHCHSKLPFQQPTRHPEMKLGDVALEGRCCFQTGYVTILQQHTIIPVLHKSTS